MEKGGKREGKGEKKEGKREEKERGEEKEKEKRGERGPNYMLELVTSKAVVAVAVLVLLSSVLGFFAIQGSVMEERSFRAMCEEIAGALDGASSVSARFTVNFTSGDGGGGCRIAPLFRGHAYQIEVRTGQVILRQNELSVSEGLLISVHPWDPALLNGSLHTSKNALAQLDSENPALRVSSAKGFTLVREAVSISGSLQYTTFVFSIAAR